ncbi:uroporphyrinogen-III synthase [Loktanella ponticola]|uniref:Uroporphyrinogen-III synthase n=1 Tax=Yoonia ponticola TaxID=1524255 RepID=A0A7W9BIM5_9RHOB|nr:uroporphyrinogen-III synthase [Yoonia ponticola]MBB5721243.1 uroporphyrinogen-III synthase [Yoonia ponticola]
MTACVLITRPKAQAAAFASALQVAHGEPLRCVISPLIEIVSLKVEGAFDDVAHVVFTSVNGVNEARRVGILQGIPAWCVGSKTAKIAMNAGFDVRIAKGDSRSLVSLIAGKSPKGRMVHVRGRHVAGTVIESLDAVGIHCEAVMAYDQVAVMPTQAAIDVLRGENPVIVPLFSPCTAKLFSQIADFNAPLHLVVMSDAIDVQSRDTRVFSRVIAGNGAGLGMLESTLAAYAQFSP